MQNKKNEIIIFENQKIKLEVNLKEETVWLNLDQMSKLFERDKSVISRHIKNVLEEECDKSTIAKFATVQAEGNRNITRNIDYYNLDVIISVGYRVKSKRGIEFRKWANKVLKEYLIKGYAVNEKRLKALEKTIQLIDIASRDYKNLDYIEAKDIIKILQSYTKSLTLLDDYDHKCLDKPKGRISNEKITYKNAIDLINTLKFKEESEIFGLERDKGLESIINNIYQTFSGLDVYESIEEKAANFLYMVVKNHVFIDGNKRIAATLLSIFYNFMEYYIMIKI